MSRDPRFALLVVAPIALSSIAIARTSVADPVLPDAIIDRPRTLPGGELEIDGTGNFLQSPTGTTLGTIIAREVESSVQFGLGAGLTDHLELLATYERGLTVGEGAYATMGFGLAYRLPALGRLSWALDAAATWQLKEGGLNPPTFGLDAQFRLSSHVALYTPGQQFDVSSAANHPDTLNLPIGVRYQPRSDLFLFAQIDLASLNLGGSVNQFLMKDFIPLSGGGFVSMGNRMDIGASVVFTDLKRAADDWSLLVTARIFLSTR